MKAMKKNKAMKATKKTPCKAMNKNKATKAMK